MLMHNNFDTDFLDRVLQEPERTTIHTKIQSMPRCGLLVDWGYAVPVNAAPINVFPADKPTLGATPAVHVEGEDKLIPCTCLKDMHNIVIPVADEPLPSDFGLSTDGTWAWMAAELSHISPGTPVVHQHHHDLESFFYILLAICLLYDEPGRLKPPKVLMHCFDPFFAITHPSTLKLITIQSDFSWTAHILPYISKYFQPLILLLEELRKQLILPIKLQENKVRANCQLTHNDFIDGIIVVLSKLLKNCWDLKYNLKSIQPIRSFTQSPPPVFTFNSDSNYVLHR
ncbi:hypothetical protein OG21DRAFT_1491853 [Imleria badia]|nr:hypothetical protein OG21DRAFT_1491853 [Imleria badia]